jgi:ABC-2 type transport system permease protein
MRRFYVLLKKELRELITPQIFAPLVVVIVLFYALGQLLGAQGTAAQAGFPVVVVDGDKTATSALVVTALEQNGFKVGTSTSGTAASPSASETASQLALSLPKSDGNIVVSIPAGFESGLASNKPQQIQTWAVVRTFSFLGQRDVSALSGALTAVNQAIAAEVAKRAAPSVPLTLLQRPVQVVEHVVVGNKQAAAPVAAVMGFVSQQTTFIPIVLFIVIIFAAQMIATAIAAEKENKTLETLLSYPISRASIVTAKMMAAGLVALVSAGVYMLGMRSYMGGIERSLGGGGQAAANAAAASEATMRALGLTFGVGDYALLGLSLFAGILVALSIAIILGAFAESVKAVQALLTPLMILLLVPYFLTLFVDLATLPTAIRYIVMAIPFTYPFMAGPNLFLGNFGQVWFGIGYELLWFAVFVFFAARIFSSDRILTMKLNLSRKRRGATA